MGSLSLRLPAVAAAFALAACGHGGAASQTDAQSQTAQIGHAAPDWSEPMLNGGNLSFASLRGKPIYLNFFATWCDGCKAESAALETVSREYRARGVKVVGVDILEGPGKAAQFHSEQHLTYPFVIDSGTLRRQYNINGLPVQVFIDRNGVVQRIALGQMSLADMRSNVERILR
ncbi:MAG TPA: TlpA disulfide reductase family protein [Candidatus Baltobacteraceae bacterium]|jgi:cytochrome c biogenesis protein CcmG/thiol:disulfide interchange protein DsbE|nr:TlpA disulfide reductase family protein [Candidatus Baltobacteraceae bacterium]